MIGEDAFYYSTVDDRIPSERLKFKSHIKCKMFTQFLSILLILLMILILILEKHENSQSNEESQVLFQLISNIQTSIGESAFQKCSDLKEITIPSSVTTIGDNYHAFRFCSFYNSVMNVQPFINEKWFKKYEQNEEEEELEENKWVEDIKKELQKIFMTMKFVNLFKKI